MTMTRGDDIKVGDILMFGRHPHRVLMFEPYTHPTLGSEPFVGIARCSDDWAMTIEHYGNYETA